MLGSQWGLHSVRNIVFILAALSISAAAQTQIDLRTQTKPDSRPVKTGPTIPTTCAIGDLFLRTNSPTGANLYACVGGNQWVAQSGQGGVTLSSDGVTIGTEPAQNMIGGTGIVNAISDTGSRFDIVHMIDTAVVETRATAQSGTGLFCASAGGSGQNYTCSMTPTLAAYTQGMLIRWKPDVTGTGGPTTLSIDALNAAPVKMDDGATDPTTGDLIGGEMIDLWYDGAVFRLMYPEPVRSTDSASRPACSSAQRGRMWHTKAAPGVKDDVSVCAKDAADQYAWRTLY